MKRIIAILAALLTLTGCAEGQKEEIKKQYYLNLETDGGSQNRVWVVSPTNRELYEQESEVTIQAEAGEDFTFAGWSDSIGKSVSTNNPYTFTITGNTILTGKFTRNPKYYTISWAVEGDAANSITATPAEQSTDNSITVLEQTEVTLTAIPAAGYSFREWSDSQGRALSGDRVYRFNATADVSFKALFTRDPVYYTLGWTIEGGEGNKIALSPSTSNATENSDKYLENTEITMTAYPAKDYNFDRWRTQSGETASTESPFSFKITSDTTFVAAFVSKNYKVKWAADQGGSVEVTKEGTIITECPDCYEGTELIFTAWPNDGYLFERWKDERGTTVSTDNPYRVTVTSDLNLTAVFKEDQIDPQTLAFPTAEGYGRYATGGRGGKVVEVTTLDDDGTDALAGSFRWALKQHKGSPITIVFGVSGTIDLKGNAVRSQRNDITIAGQTAPGDGICFKGGCLNFGGSRNLIVRHIRSRIGLLEPGDEFLAGASFNIENGGNFIIDHCSFTWSAEESVDFYDDDLVTAQWCIMGEGLYDAGHGKGSRGYGPVLGGKTSTYHHNLISNTVSRSPRFGATTKNDKVMMIDYVNNVHYNWGKKTAFYGGDNRQGDAGEFKLNHMNNYFKPGPAYTPNNCIFLGASWHEDTGTSYGRWHLEGNYMYDDDWDYSAMNADNYLGFDVEKYEENGVTKDQLISDYMPVPYPINMETAESAYQSVLERVGARPLDTVDARLIEETRTRTVTYHGCFNNNRLTGIIDKPSDAGGYPELKTYNQTTDSDGDGIPDFWENANSMDPNNADDGNKLSRRGYTYLEVYLNGLCGEQIGGFRYPTK